MLIATLVGNVGADAQKKSADGRNFTTFRVAHNDDWTDQSGQRHSSTMWVDCVLNDHPKVADYIKAGTMVAVTGTIKTRVYSSEKDRCMKAGIQISVRTIELLGGSADEVPRRLYDTNGVQHDIKKAFYSDVKGCTLMSQRGQQYNVDKKGWITPVQPTTTPEASAEGQQPQSQDYGAGPDAKAF